MMKHISKTALLFGALTILTSTIPLQARVSGARRSAGDSMSTQPPQVYGPQVEPTRIMGIPVQQRTGIVSEEHARSARLSKLKKELDEKWKELIACIQKGRKCPGIIKAVQDILASINKQINEHKGISAIPRTKKGGTRSGK